MLLIPDSADSVCACAAWIMYAASSIARPSSAACAIVTTMVTIAAKWLVTYGKTSLFLDSHGQGHTDPTAMFRWGGIGIQLGSAIGSVLFFLLTVTWDVFHNEG